MEGQVQCDYEPTAAITPKWKARTALLVSCSNETHNTHQQHSQESTNTQGTSEVETNASTCRNATKAEPQMEKENVSAHGDSKPKPPANSSDTDGQKQYCSSSKKQCKCSDKELIISIRDVLMELGANKVDSLLEKVQRSRSHTALQNKEALERFIRSAPKAFIMMQTNGKVHLKKLVNVPARITCGYYGYCFASLTQRPKEAIFIPYSTIQQADSRWINLCHPSHIGRLITADGYGRDQRELLGMSGNIAEWCATKAVLSGGSTDSDRDQTIDDDFQTKKAKTSKSEDPCVKEAKEIAERTRSQTKAMLDNVRAYLRERGPVPIGDLYGRITGKKKHQVEEFIHQFPHVFEVEGQEEIVQLRTKAEILSKVVRVFTEHCLAEVEDEDKEEVLVPHSSFPSDVRQNNNSLLNYLRQGDTIKVEIEGQDGSDYESGTTLTPKWRARKAHLIPNTTRVAQSECETQQTSATINPKGTKTQDTIGSKPILQGSSERSTSNKVVDSDEDTERDTTVLPEKASQEDPETSPSTNSCESCDTDDQPRTKNWDEKSLKSRDRELLITLRYILFEHGSTTIDDIRKKLFEIKHSTPSLLLSKKVLWEFLKSAPNVFLVTQPNEIVQLKKLANASATITAVYKGYCFASLNQHPKEEIYIPFQTIQQVKERQTSLHFPSHIGCLINVDGYGRDPREFIGGSSRMAEWCATRGDLDISNTDSEREKGNSVGPNETQSKQFEAPKDKDELHIEKENPQQREGMDTVSVEKTCTQIVYDPNNPKQLLDQLRTCLTEKGSLPINSLYGCIHGKNQCQVKQIIQQFPNVFEIKGQHNVVHLRKRFDVEAKVVTALSDDYIARIEGGQGEEVLIPQSLLPSGRKSQVQFLEGLLEQGDVVRLDIEGQDKCDYEPDATFTPKWKARKVVLVQATTNLPQAESIGLKDQTGSTASLAQQLTEDITRESRESENICQNESSVRIQRSSSSDLLPTHSQETSTTSSFPCTSIPKTAIINVTMPVAECSYFQVESNTVGASCQTEPTVPESQVMSNSSAASCQTEFTEPESQVVVNTADASCQTELAGPEIYVVSNTACASCQTELTGHVLGTMYFGGIS